MLTEGAMCSLAGKVPSVTGDSLVQQTLLGHTGVPNDIAQVAVFLASDEVNWVTGEILSISSDI